MSTHTKDGKAYVTTLNGDTFQVNTERPMFVTSRDDAGLVVSCPVLLPDPRGELPPVRTNALISLMDAFFLSGAGMRLKLVGKDEDVELSLEVDFVHPIETEARNNRGHK